MSGVVAVFGISGVGKTRLISSFAAENSGVMRVSASALIKEAINAPSVDALRTSTEQEIRINQFALIDAFKEYRRENVGPIVFDGHTVIDSDGGGTIVPFETIAAIEPRAMVVIEAPVERIYEQRSLDKARKRPIRTLKELEEQQQLSREIAFRYASLLNIDAHSVQSGDLRTFSSIVIAHLR